MRTVVVRLLATVSILALMGALQTMIPPNARAAEENLLKNPSFEILDTGTDHPTDWVGGHAKSTSWITSPDGVNYGYAVGPDETMYQDVEVGPNANMTLRFWSGTHPHSGEPPRLRFQILKTGVLVDEEVVEITRVLSDTNGIFEGPITLRLISSEPVTTTARVLIEANSGWGKVDNLSLSVLYPRDDPEPPEEPEHSVTVFLPLTFR